MAGIYSKEMRKVCVSEEEREKALIGAKLRFPTSDEECNYSRISRHMVMVQMCLHSALSWGWLITRDRGEREEQGQSLPLCGV